jgi:hypothetical protein
MVALYVALIATGVAVLQGLGRPFFGNRRSIKRYHKAMAALGEISEHLHPPETAESEHPSPPASTEDSLEAGTPAAAPEDREGVPRDAPPTTPAPSISPPLDLESRSLSAHQIDNRRPPRPPLFPRTGRGRGLRSRRALLVLFAAAVVALVGIAAGLALSPGPTSGKRVASPSSRRSHSSRPSSKTTTSPTTSSAQTSTTTSTTSAASSTAGPVLSSLEPNTGAVGQVLTLTGSGFMSANGTIVATFNSHPAPTRCPSERLCLVTVPAGLHGSVAVRLHTESGESNALTFHDR